MGMATNQSQKPLAVVTGASSGIGLELARQFAQNGFDLIICSEGERLFAAEKELKQYGGQVECVQADLASFEGVEDLATATRNSGRPLEAIAINAGVGLGGDFTQTELQEELNMINLNVTSTVHLTKCVLPDMYKQGKGKILFTSSVAAVIAGSF